jgi:D-alanine-D-alanine ligase
VFKPAFEHMSRGLRLAGTDDEAHSLSSNLLKSLHQPVLIENYIPGRELAVSLLEGPKGLEVLPPVEWRVDGSGTGMLSEAFKLVEPVTDRSEAQRADLPSPMGEELNGLSCRAFQLLGLRDYARFDVRLSPG